MGPLFPVFRIGGATPTHDIIRAGKERVKVKRLTDDVRRANLGLLGEGLVVGPVHDAGGELLG